MRGDGIIYAYIQCITSTIEIIDFYSPLCEIHQVAYVCLPQNGSSGRMHDVNLRYQTLRENSCKILNGSEVKL